jgi:hypothetical protein
MNLMDVSKLNIALFPFFYSGYVRGRGMEVAINSIVPEQAQSKRANEHVTFFTDIFLYSHILWVKQLFIVFNEMHRDLPYDTSFTNINFFMKNHNSLRKTLYVYTTF